MLCKELNVNCHPAAVNFVVARATHFPELVIIQVPQVVLTGVTHHPKVRVLTAAVVTFPTVSLYKLSQQIVQLFILSASQGCCKDTHKKNHQ